MTNNNIPELQKPIYSQCEEKPFYSNDEDSAPNPRNNQPNYYTNKNYFPNDLMVNPDYDRKDHEQPNNIDNNANNNYIQNKPEVAKKTIS